MRCDFGPDRLGRAQHDQNVEAKGTGIPSGKSIAAAGLALWSDHSLGVAGSRAFTKPTRANSGAENRA